MCEGEPEKQGFGFRREHDHHPATIRFIGLAVYQTMPRQAIHQSYNGTMRSPLTAMMFGIELTHDINSLLPLVIGCVCAHTSSIRSRP